MRLDLFFLVLQPSLVTCYDLDFPLSNIFSISWYYFARRVIQSGYVPPRHKKVLSFRIDRIAGAFEPSVSLFCRYCYIPDIVKHFPNIYLSNRRSWSPVFSTSSRKKNPFWNFLYLLNIVARCGQYSLKSSTGPWVNKLKVYCKNTCMSILNRDDIVHPLQYHCLQTIKPPIWYSGQCSIKIHFKILQHFNNKSSWRELKYNYRRSHQLCWW